MTKRNDARCQG